MSEAERIAAGLTKAMQQAVLSGATSLGGVAYGLRRRGLLYYEPMNRQQAHQALTPLGLEVRAILEGQAQAAAQEQRIADALAWLRDHIKEVDDDNSYWGGPHKRAYLDAPAILKELTARAALGEQQ